MLAMNSAASTSTTNSEAVSVVAKKRWKLLRKAVVEKARSVEVNQEDEDERASRFQMVSETGTTKTPSRSSEVDRNTKNKKRL